MLLKNEVSVACSIFRQALAIIGVKTDVLSGYLGRSSWPSGFTEAYASRPSGPLEWGVIDEMLESDEW